MIDYVIGDEKTREKIRNMIVEEKLESDHHSIIVNIRRKIKETARAETRGIEKSEERTLDRRREEGI